MQVYRLLCRNTYEMALFETASMKLGLDRAVLHTLPNTSSDDSIAKSRVSRQEAENLLRKGLSSKLRATFSY